MNRERNYRKHPHTAQFLQTFHSGISSTGRNYREEMGVTSTEERSATEFVSGQAYAGQPSYANVEANGRAANREIFISGWRILIGPGLVSEPQAKWIVDIAEKSEGVSDAMVKSLSERLAQGFARAAASEFITKYKELPRKATEPTVPVRDAQGVRPGRYALAHKDGTKFYRITEGKGRWAGRTFIEAQASDDHHPVRNIEARQAILAAIAENPLEAEQRYGRELGHCSRCGRTLTDETSRAYGIGPDCRSKY